ncbi:hypothetical protein VZT92_019688 [Zoarces viviparus]|uniref:Uncharacterized protein n=1 Tax=Zoarces viviparus TaxID=48416 RepID=A0AAW1ELM5_ZOAVI
MCGLSQLDAGQRELWQRSQQHKCREKGSNKVRCDVDAGRQTGAGGSPVHRQGPAAFPSPGAPAGSFVASERRRRCKKLKLLYSVDTRGRT